MLCQLHDIGYTETEQSSSRPFCGPLSSSSHLIHVVVDGELEALPALRREPVVVHLGVQQDAQAVLLTQLDSGPETNQGKL